MTEASPIHGIYSDAARRCSDIINGFVIHQGENAWGKWAAIRLHDGSSDGVLYDRRSHAVRFQLHETLCAYIKIPPDGMSYAAAESVLKIHRQVYDSGARFVDPEIDREPILPVTIEEYAQWMNYLRTGRRI